MSCYGSSLEVSIPSLGFCTSFCFCPSTLLDFAKYSRLELELQACQQGSTDHRRRLLLAKYRTR
jgi:hypothetical protein